MSYLKVQQIGTVRIEEDSCFIELFKHYSLGLRHLQFFNYIFVLWWISMRDTPRDRLQVLAHPPNLDMEVETGVFACRSPARPNPIGLTKVKLLKIEENKIFIDRIDAIDGTPVLDIKPYLPGDSVPIDEIKLPEWFNHLKDKK
ncbi:MAG: tRNA (N6-threonylcarbamoyladenosine(37)-N6)-methyltransferase TrmO [Candidatus Heimdallarchaeaceae archaeon]